MATDLSSNWKKLQAKIKAESTVSATAKRKAAAGGLGETDARDGPRKKQKQQPDQARRQKPRPKPTSRPANPANPAKPPMGNTQSSKIDTVPKTGVSPSLALWAADNDISSEAIAEAYGLGLQTTAITSAPTTPNAGLTPGLALGKYVAIDCEMVGVGEGGFTDELARASVVDFHGRQVYDSLVRPRERVVDWRTHVSGVAPRHMAVAREFADVQAQVAELLKGRIIVGHDVRHDLRALELGHPAQDLRDTAKFSGFKKYGHGPKPALKVLAREILGLDIQGGQHSSVEDARVAMLLFRKHKSAFDMEISSRFPDDTRPKKANKGRRRAKKS